MKEFLCVSLIMGMFTVLPIVLCAILARYGGQKSIRRVGMNVEKRNMPAAANHDSKSVAAAHPPFQKSPR